MNKIEILATKDTSSNGLVVCLKPKIPFVITESLAHDLRHLQDVIADNYYKNVWDGPFYIIWHLHTGKIPWKGIDFSFVYHALKEHKEKKIECYLGEIFDLLFFNHTGLGLPVINCSIITRPLTGISQDFFYLNQINFIKNRDTYHDTIIKEKNFCQLKKNLYFPENFYSKNSYYSYYKFNPLKVKQLLDKKNPIQPNNVNHREIKKIFDQAKMNVLRDIDELATRNIKLIERLARRQATEHQIFQ